MTDEEFMGTILRGSRLFGGMPIHAGLVSERASSGIVQEQSPRARARVNEDDDEARFQEA